MKRRFLSGITAALMVCGLLAGCGSGSSGTPDDYATNEGYTTSDASDSTSDSTDSSGSGIAKSDIKVGVLYISDPNEGSGYSYTHDLGIQGM